MDEKMLSLEQEIKIKEKALKLKEEKKLRKICPMVVFGDTANGEKEIYVAYMSEPSFPQFSKFMAASKKDEVIAMRTLARDCFVDGDKELVGDKICNFITYWFTVTYNVYQRAVLNLVSFWYHYITFVIISLNFISYIFLLYF